MAVYTHISASDLKKYINLFDIGDSVSFAGITEGVENTNYRLVTTQGDFILTLFEKRSKRDDLPFFIAYMKHLRGKGINCPAVIAAKSGETLVPFNGQPAIITTFLQGQWPKHPDAGHTQAVGTLLGCMHNAGQDFSMRRDNSMGPATWRTLIDACGSEADNLEPGLTSLLQTELTWQEKHLPQGLPAGTVHADLFPDNVFFTGKELTGVIDFYFACTETFTYDLMLTVNAWCFSGGQMDKAKSTALLGSYKKIRTLSEEETALLPFFGRAAALRIIATRLYDWLHRAPDAVVNVKDPMEYIQILKFYQDRLFAA